MRCAVGDGALWLPDVPLRAAPGDDHRLADELINLIHSALPSMQGHARALPNFLVAQNTQIHGEYGLYIGSRLDIEGPPPRRFDFSLRSGRAQMAQPSSSSPARALIEVLETGGPCAHLSPVAIHLDGTLQQQQQQLLDQRDIVRSWFEGAAPVPKATKKAKKEKAVKKEKKPEATTETAGAADRWCVRVGLR